MRAQFFQNAGVLACAQQQITNLSNTSADVGNQMESEIRNWFKEFLDTLSVADQAQSFKDYLEKKVRLRNGYNKRGSPLELITYGIIQTYCYGSSTIALPEGIKPVLFKLMNDEFFIIFKQLSDEEKNQTLKEMKEDCFYENIPYYAQPGWLFYSLSLGE